MDNNKIGALWINEKNGKKYMSGSVEINGQAIRIVVFKNNYKEQDKHPDYNIMLSQPQQNQQQQNGQQQQNNATQSQQQGNQQGFNQTAQTNADNINNNFNDNGENIPF